MGLGFGFTVRGALQRTASAMLHTWVVVVWASLALTVLRAGQIVYHWPGDLQVNAGDLWSVMFQGGRFDLKASATVGLLLFPLFALMPRRTGPIAGAFVFILVLLSLINLHYFGFYKTPIDPIVFGFFEDDTRAIVRTIWSDFPVVLTLLTLASLSIAAIAASRWMFGRLEPRLVSANRPTWVLVSAVLLAFVLLVFSIKGTLRSIGLVRQNLTVTTSQFLNDMVPNGAIALLFAFDQRGESQDLKDPMVRLHRLGFDTPMEAAKVLGINAANPKGVREAMYVNGSVPVAGPNRKNLLFVMMESWSAEPFLYQSERFDVLGRLEQTLPDACHFSNFDSAQGGTHPTLEAILFSTPITPLTTGVEGKRPLPWSVPLLLKQAGYRTVFITSGRSGWRDMNRIMKTQGFDEVVDALTLQQAYPEAKLGVWGVWDSYAFRYLTERLDQPSDKPLFAFVMTMTNHPPYDLPPDYSPPELDLSEWGGERNSDDLGVNLSTYRYATDLLGGLVQKIKAGPHYTDTVIAASGDHNTRTFGVYATPERRHLVKQVPFVLWGKDVDCGSQLDSPASHRDMFPTLFPLIGIQGGYVNTGRDLLTRQGTGSPLDARRIGGFDGHARNHFGAWRLGNRASFVCTPVVTGNGCRFDAQDDLEERARLGLLDWFIRSSLQAR